MPTLTIDGRQLVPISADTYHFVRGHLPRVPLKPGLYWLENTCWMATYRDTTMRPEDFAGWECLNPILDVTV